MDTLYQGFEPEEETTILQASCTIPSNAHQLLSESLGGASDQGEREARERQDLHTSIAKVASQLSQALAARLDTGGGDALEKAEDSQHLSALIEQDVKSIIPALVHLKQDQGLRCVKIKLLLMGKNRCSRWHKDTYVGRAIVTYNGCGTQFQPDENNIDFSKLRSQDPQVHDSCIRDPSKTVNLSAGDIFYMRGLGDTLGPVYHRSPPIRILPTTNEIQQRLILKMDVALDPS